MGISGESFPSGMQSSMYPAMRKFNINNAAVSVRFRPRRTVSEIARLERILERRAVDDPLRIEIERPRRRDLDGGLPMASATGVVDDGGVAIVDRDGVLALRDIVAIMDQDSRIAHAHRSRLGIGADLLQLPLPAFDPRERRQPRGGSGHGKPATQHQPDSDDARQNMFAIDPGHSIAPALPVARLLRTTAASTAIWGVRADLQ
jgi:hypothetical protein